jgi:hypothetical protein
MDIAAAAGGALDGFIVNGHKVGIARKVQIGFDKRDALRNRAAKSGQRIFRGIT